MRKFTALHYTIFMIAALAMLVAVPSAYAATVKVDPGCADGDRSTLVCDDPTTYRTIRSAITAATAGDTISISTGTYSNEYLLVNKALTVESDASANAKVTLSGTSAFRINSTDVTIQGITFQNVTRDYSIFMDPGVSDLTIHNNTFADTRYHAVRTLAAADKPIRDLSITDNVFKNIGTFYEPGLNVTQKAKKLMSAMYFVSDKPSQAGLHNSTITGNTIDTTTYAGLVIKGAKNILIQYNTISNVPANGITLQLSEQIKILDNHIDDANNVLFTLDGNEDKNTQAAIILWGDQPRSHVTVSNNTISGGHNGIVYCPIECDIDTPDAKAKTDETNLFTRNIFDNVKGFYIMNQATGPLIATHNYYGTAEPDFRTILSGDVHYNPYYNDPELKVLVADKTGTVQKSTADLDVSDVCSISLGTYIMDFADAKYGAASSIVQNQIKNAGNQDLGGIKFTSTGWQKPDGSALSDAVSRVGTDVTSSASYTPIPTNQSGINFNAANFTGSNTLPASGSPDSALVGFVLDLTGVATGPDVTVTESITYSATCS